MMQNRFNLNHLIKFIFSRAFFRQVIVAFFVLLVLYWVNTFILRKYTHHGQALTVPNFKGYTIKQVEQVCKEKGFQYVIIDSMYKPDVPFFTVLEQTPKPLSKVKKNRRIYLTISSDNPPLIKMPDLTDVSLQQAIVILKSYGLKTGDLEYIPDIGLNLVLKVKYQGRVIKPGTVVKKGSTIDLVLGDGLTSEKVPVQDFRGLTVDEAVFALAGLGLNAGLIQFDNSVSDTSKAIIYKQYPLSGPDMLISQGESVDLWLTSPANFDKMVRMTENDTINKK